MKVGLYFGSFNPIHVGHLIIANHIVEYSDLNQVWFVVTPHNPFKEKATLLDNYQRLEMVYRATKDYDQLAPSAIEFNLPQPNYTAHTLAYLQEKHPDHEFALIMGQDNLAHFHKWKNYEFIRNNYPIYVYPRITKSESKTAFNGHKNIQLIDAPVIDISSSFIRKGIQKGKNVKPLLPENVWEYLEEMNFYK